MVSSPSLISESRAVPYPPSELLTDVTRNGWSPAQIQLGRALIVVGILLRGAIYFANRSLWGDEASLAVNLVNRSFGQLCQPLDYEQGAPIGFLFIERTAVLLLGRSEFSLRLIPLLSGILLLVLLFTLARRYLSGGMGLAALAMAVFSKSLIHYSVELKQYSSDAMLALLLLCCAMQIHKRLEANGNTGRAIGWFAIVSTTAVWFSHPAVFVLAGAACILAMREYHRGRIIIALQICIATALGGASALIHYFLFARALTHDSYLTTFWASGMMPLYPPLKTMGWFYEEIPKSLEGLFGKSGIALVLLFFGLGCISLWRTDRKNLLALLLAPTLITLCASALHKYPFSDRLIVFLLPPLILLLAAGFEGICHALPHRHVWIAFILLGGLLAEPSVIAVKAAFNPRVKEEMKPALAYLKSHRKNDDAIYINFHGRPAFEYYAHRYGFDPTQVLLGDRPSGQVFLQAELSPFLGRKRVWVLRTNPDDKAEHRLQAALAALGAVEVEQDSYGGVQVSLYDLSGGIVR